MIAVDTSAIVAIVFDEAERAMFRQIIQRASKALISTVSALEARLVIHGRRGQRGIVLVEGLLRLPGFEIVRRAAERADQPFHRLGRHLLAEAGAGGA